MFKVGLKPDALTTRPRCLLRGRGLIKREVQKCKQTLHWQQIKKPDELLPSILMQRQNFNGIKWDEPR